MPNPCPHRGFPLDENGRCPYHGMSFGDPLNQQACFDNTLREIPEFNHPDLREVNRKMGEKFFSTKFDVKAPAHLWMQNTADFHHLRNIHKDGFAKLFKGIPFDVRISKEPGMSSHRVQVQPEIAKAYRAILKQPGLPDNFLHILIYPNISITSFMDVFFSIETAFRKTETETTIVSSFFVSNEFEVPQPLIAVATEANEKILEEDKATCEKWWPTYKVSGNWLPGEERVKHYAESWERF